MITRISLKNFYSLRDEAIIDFTASPQRYIKSPATAKNTFTENGIQLLKSIAIFGANASGKTNVLKAISACVNYVLNSQNYTDLTLAEFTPFKFSSKDTPSSFEIELTIEGEKYIYGFSIIDRKITEEYLYSFPKKYKTLIFKRMLNNNGETTYNFSKKFIRPKEIVTSTTPFNLFLSRAAQMGREDAIKIMNYFGEQITIGLPSFDSTKFEELILQHKAIITDALYNADSDIIDFDFKSDMASSTHRKLFTYHKNNPTQPFAFNEEESAGTRKLIGILIAFIDAAQKNKFLIIDELESSLHPQLIKYAVKHFNNETNAQIIFSTHSTNLLDINILRPDQIYFTSKCHDDGATELYSLIDFTDYKKYDNLNRDYNQGRFDAIPILS